MRYSPATVVRPRIKRSIIIDLDRGMVGVRMSMVSIPPPLRPVVIVMNYILSPRRTRVEMPAR